MSVAVELLTWEDTWRFGFPKSPMWESEGEAWSEDESVSSRVSGEDNVCNEALHFIGLSGPSDQVSLFLQGWELAKVALSCHTTRGILSWNCYFTNILAASCYSPLMNSIWLRFLFLVSLLWIYFATRKVITFLNDASGTIAITFPLTTSRTRQSRPSPFA